MIEWLLKDRKKRKEKKAEVMTSVIHVFIFQLVGYYEENAQF